MYTVYVISSLKRKYLYVGITNDLSRRFNQHNSGKERITFPYKPFKIVLVEKYQTRTEARRREKYLKSGVGKEWIKKLI